MKLRQSNHPPRICEESRRSEKRELKRDKARYERRRARREMRRGREPESFDNRYCGWLT